MQAQEIVAEGGTVEDLAALDSTETDALATELGLTECGSNDSGGAEAEPGAAPEAETEAESETTP